MHATPTYLPVFIRSRRASRVSPPIWKAPSRIEKKKSKKVIHFHPILCIPAPFIMRSQRESKYEGIVQEARRKTKNRNVWGQMKERNRLITNFWVAKPKKLATHRCFYETRVIEPKSKTKSSMCKGKGNKLFRKCASPSIPNTWPVFPPVFMPSCFERQTKI